MNRLLNPRRITILFVSLFVVLTAGVLLMQRYWIAPEDACIDSGRWWYEEGRECVQPISIAEITGRPIGVSRAEASLEKNRELVEIERRLAVERTARAAAIERDRRALESKAGI
ncbi:hypothetical protein BZG35_00930 [Brevundimonas sp. LM2]|uniref:hypothetical protein n=1 Tax=Brevundimonas sp. LM2 TaxID=1938605 RepID=UPI000983B3DF|nr:hypothetical protein [Brevundimonas sp. LM2]AQR60378.1 hypothetical protein BZG35_00930 [Brevundimonas sp. LM2]